MDNNRSEIGKQRSWGASLSSSLFLGFPALVWLLPLAFLGLFYFYPLLEILRVSLTGEQGVAALKVVLGAEGSYFLGVLWFTIWQAVISTLSLRQEDFDEVAVLQ